MADFVKAEKLTRIDDDQEPTFAIAVVSQPRRQWLADLRPGTKAILSETELWKARHPLAILPIMQAFIAIHRQFEKFLRADARIRRC